MSGYKKNAASNRDALFGAAAPRASQAKGATGTTTIKVPSSTSTSNSSKGYTPTVHTAKSKSSVSSSLLSPAARAAKLSEALDYRAKANECMKTGFFKRPDPVAACTYFKRAADAYQQLGDGRLERLFRLESGHCNRQCGAWASAASDYTRAAELILHEDDDYGGDNGGDNGGDGSGTAITTTTTTTPLDDRRRDAASYHKYAAEAWTQMNEPAKAAASLVAAALALQFGAQTSYLSKEALTGLEQAVEAHVPDPLNPYARYRQTGTSAFVDNDVSDQQQQQQQYSDATKELAQAHLVTRAYAHEPLQDLVNMLTSYQEYQSALYAAGAVSVILKNDGVSTLSLARAYVVETILTLALGDAVQAEQQFLNRHVQDTNYLKSRECQLAEELYRAVKQRDSDALDTARSITGPNRSALANLPHDALRVTVQSLRVSGVARKATSSTTTDEPNEAALPSLADLMKQKTGYETEDNIDTAGAEALSAELDNLDFGSDIDDDDNGNFKSGDDELDALEDDDIDLR